MNRCRPSSCRCPFDAVLIISFGGPRGRADVGPFLKNVLGARHASGARIEEAAGKYLRFNGVSPLPELTQRQARGLQKRLQHRGIDLTVYVGMRNWHPLIADVLCEMSRAGVRRAIGFIAAAHHCYPSCGQYKQNVIDARHTLRERGLPDIRITYVDSWYDHDGFVAVLARHIREGLSKLDPALGDEARIVFTAHSLPTAVAETCRYQEQLAATARLVAQELRRRDYALVYQSRSGRPEDPWLEPDICDYLRAERAKGLRAVVISPIGFICENIELLFDLDVRAAEVCRELNLPMVRAETVNDDPVFLHMMADVVQQTWQRYREFPPLPIVGTGKDTES